MVLGSDLNGGWALLEELRRGGVAPAALLRGLLPEVARTLDERWRLDQCSSVERTVGVCHLRTLAHHLLSVASASRFAFRTSREITVLSPPGDRLDLAPVVHECRMELLGWHVERLEGVEPDQVVRHHRNHHVDFTYCSVSDKSYADSAGALLLAVRAASVNQRLRAMGIGGGWAGCEDRLSELGLDGLVAKPRLEFT